MLIELTLFLANRIEAYAWCDQIMLENMKYDSAELKADIGTKTGLFATIQEFMSIRSEKAGHKEVN